ncbi:Crp/Fnr family transcriptional regulator [Blastopirellula sp. JC732]|uniref:Crp/Fnr family transcriptional regulator n=1 Tax=Blastopirellula sediminis TaxID=2894196 RepID=A0A9X1MLN8_9BACT|nr:Crp/Fnr family transcriptional regulator [Blastopirellula sediminis]MCC9608347.1 Crp/Fnr family transcriptional regulator [Blastopirellula sediminis]MCC9628876.1 Crp/Fnr family transcriptional regulator [Blastopirellula sediminis]
MSDSELIEVIRRVDCFQGISEEDLQTVAAMGHVVEYDKSATIFREGDAAVTSYVVISGTVSLEICAPGFGCRRISTVREGEFLGWSPVLDNLHLTVTGRTVEPTRLVELPKQELLALCERSPRFGYSFMRGIAQTLARRLNAARMQLLNLFGDEAESSLGSD